MFGLLAFVVFSARDIFVAISSPASKGCLIFVEIGRSAVTVYVRMDALDITSNTHGRGSGDGL